MDEPDKPLSREAKTLLRYAAVCDLRADADRTAALVRATLRPLPVLPADPAQREATLTILLLQARERKGISRTGCK